MDCKHNYPKRKMLPRYVTAYFLMCGDCKGKIRKLTGEDRGRLNYATYIKEIYTKETGEYL